MFTKVSLLLILSLSMGMLLSSTTVTATSFSAGSKFLNIALSGPGSGSGSGSSGSQDTVFRVKPVEGWKRQAYATLGAGSTITSEIQKSNIKLEFPSGWTKYEKGPLIILTPSIQVNLFKNIVVSSYPSEYTNIRKSANEAIQMYKSQLNNFKLLSINSKTVGSQPAVYLTYSYNEPQVGETMVMEVGVIKGGTEYLIQYFSNPTIFSKDVPLLMNLANSIQFKP